MGIVSIGILAYNEESGIASTIRTVFEQSVFQQAGSGFAAELIVVPNGCKDRTAECAARAIEDGLRGVDESLHSGRVCEISEPGKERAWNHFVHEASRRDAEFLVLMDADVRLEHEHVLRDLVESLRSHPEAYVAAGTPVKHIELKKNPSIIERISIGASRLRWGMKGVVAGCLYCGRSDWLRSFRLPTALMGEDAFVRAMTVTRGFTVPDDPSLVVRVPTARVIFDAYTSPSEVMRNKTRRMLELTINAILYTKLWASATKERPATVLMMEWDAENPRWSEELVANEVGLRGKKFVPSEYVTSQFRQLRHHRALKKAVLFPVALATLPINAVAARRANRAVQRGEIRKLWDKPLAPEISQ